MFHVCGAWLCPWCLGLDEGLYVCAASTLGTELSPQPTLTCIFKNVCVHVHVCACVCTMVCTSGDQRTTWSQLSPPCGSHDQTQVIRYGGKCLYILCHLANPLLIFLESTIQWYLVYTHIHTHTPRIPLSPQTFTGLYNLLWSIWILPLWSFHKMQL